MARRKVAPLDQVLSEIKHDPSRVVASLFMGPKGTITVETTGLVTEDGVSKQYGSEDEALKTILDRGLRLLGKGTFKK